MNLKRTVTALIMLIMIASVVRPATGAASGISHFGRFLASTAGTLDRSFNHSGFVVVPHQVYSVNDVRVSTNGNIVIAVDFAGLGGGIGGFGIARLLSNGTIDKAFGSGGVAVAQFGNGLNIAMSTATQPDGKIVVVGVGSTQFPHPITTMAIARFTTNGALDSSFGAGGRLSISVPGATNSAANVVVLLPSGQILIGGSGKFTSGVSGVLLRLNVDGSIDSSFGSGGFANAGLGAGINGLGLQADGKIVALSGTTALRFLPNGSVDPNTVRGTLVAETHNRTSMLTADERIIVAGGLFDGKGSSDIDTQVLRLFPNGSVDPSFQSPLFDYVRTSPDIFQNAPNAIATQVDGSVVVGGDAVTQSGAIEFGLARLLGSGAFDSTFGQGGITVSKLDGGDEVGAVGLQPNGDILAGGIDMSKSGGLIVARYLGR